jgi:hypothetical protein
MATKVKIVPKKSSPLTSTSCHIKIVQTGIINCSIFSDIYFNDALLYKGLQNKNIPIPSFLSKAVLYDGTHKHTRVLMLNVPNHIGIEMHECNYYWELKGCIGVGFHRDGEMITESVKALNSLTEKIKAYSNCFVELQTLVD